MVDDLGKTTRTSYDTANRPQMLTDAMGNTASYIYDAHDNLIALWETHTSEVVGISNQLFVTQYTYDNLDRRVATVDSAGNTNRNFYDSRDNLTDTLDALGNQTSFKYDGMDRLRIVWRYMTTNGTGAGAITGKVVTEQSWDDSSRLVSQTDGASNTTTYVYDALDRLVRTVTADTNTNRSAFDTRGNLIAATNANGTVVVFTYDLLDRCTNKTIAPGPGVATDTTFERFQYDGLSRLVRTEDDDSLVTRSYDSLSHPVKETLNGKYFTKTVTRTWDGVGNKLATTYPGGRYVSRLYDGLNQLIQINDSYSYRLLASYSYIGPGRVERRNSGNNTRSAYQYDGLVGVPNAPGDYGVRRLARATLSRSSDGLVLDDHGFAWDAEQNRIARRDLRTNGPAWAHHFAYDSIHRLQQTTVTNSAGSILRDTSYAFDGADNRTAVSGAPDPGDYTLSATLPEPADKELNQYTTTPFDSRSYDRSGNLTSILIPPSDMRGVAYDYRNQMVRYTNATANTVHSYAYDALGRRTRRTIQSGDQFATTRYFYDGWQMVEEQNDIGVTLVTYVYGRGLNDVLSFQRDSSYYWFHADDLGNVLAVSDASGLVVERYEYLDYGVPLFFDANNSPLGQSAIGNSLLFAGHRYDAETGLYYCRARYLDPRAGRFITRDPIGMWGDGANRGNAYNYVGNNPQTWSDPSGAMACYGQWLDLGFDNCSENQKASLKQSACTAYRASRQSTMDVAYLLIHDMFNSDRSADDAGVAGPSPGVGATRARVAKWFGGPDGKTSLKSKQIIGTTLQKIRDGFLYNEVGFECKSEPHGNRLAYTTYVNFGWFGGKQYYGGIEIYPPYWTTSGPAKQAAIVAHEMSHYYAGTEDYFYITEFGQYYGLWITLPGETPYPELNRHHGFETDVLRKNADSYDGFLLDFYTPAPAAGSSD